MEPSMIKQLIEDLHYMHDLPEDPQIFFYEADDSNWERPCDLTLWDVKDGKICVKVFHESKWRDFKRTVKYNLKRFWR